MNKEQKHKDKTAAEDEKRRLETNIAKLAGEIESKQKDLKRRESEYNALRTELVDTRSKLTENTKKIYESWVHI